MIVVTDRNLNFLPLNIDLTKPGAVEALSVTSPHSGTSDSSDSDDEKQPTPDKQNSQVPVSSCNRLLKRMHQEYNVQNILTYFKIWNFHNIPMKTEGFCNIPRQQRYVKCKVCKILESNSAIL